MFEFLSNIFKSTNKVITTTYSAEEIQAAITLEVLAYVESLKKEITEQTLPKEIEEEYYLLQSTGFTGSANMQRIEELKKMIKDNNDARQRNIEAVKFMSALYDTFGKSCLLIKFEDFLYLMKKYNLACGELKDYTGIIPLENLREIKQVKESFKEVHSRSLTEHAKKRINENFMNKSPSWIDNNGFYNIWEEKPNYGFGSIFTEDEYDYNYHNPILHRHFKPIHKIYKIYNYSNITPEIKEQLSRFPFDIEDKSLKVSVDSRSFNTELFICAPAQEIKTDVEFTERRKAEDPFICSYTDLGIVIFSKWGNEANDEIFNRYEELKKAIELQRSVSTTTEVR